MIISKATIKYALVTHNSRMPMNKIKSICSIACFFIYFTAGADSVLVLSLKPYPTMPEQDYCHLISRSIREQGQIALHCIYGISDKQVPIGIFATNRGYLTISDQLGQIAFPYKLSKPVIDLLITPKIQPVMMFGNTVHHWQLEPHSHAVMYRYILEQDASTKLYYWTVQQIALPQNGQIPLNAVILFAKPHNIYIPLGITPTKESANYVLPDMYVKKGINNASQSLYLLELKHLFGSVRHLDKNDALHAISLINP